MKNFHFDQRPIQSLQHLSLDVVFGACAGMYFFAHLLGLHLNWILYLLMGMAVWSIYTMDHLLDARQLQGVASTGRHRFHQNNFKTLLTALGVVVAIGLGVGLYVLQVSLISISAAGLGVMIVGNMVLVKFFIRKLAVIKEVNIALFYTIGIMLIPYLLSREEAIHKGFWLLGFAYFLIALMNLWMLSLMDAEADEKDGFASIVTLLGQERVRKLLFILMVITLLYILTLYWLLFSFYYFHISILLIIALIHSIELLKLNQLQLASRQKMEASFLLPFLLLFF
jgi:4-hydroxybenzoate polyprenyltransferase